LMDVGRFVKQNGRMPSRRILKFWNITKDGLLAAIYGFESQDLRVPSEMEVKTCGHCAHLACFKAYVDTIRVC
jgi:hypothetical protein